MKKVFVNKNNSSDTMSKLSKDMDSNMVKAAMNLNLTNYFKYLFRLMKIFTREALNLVLMVRLTMVTRVRKWLNRGVGGTNIGRFMPMFMMNRGYWARFSNCFFYSKGNLKNNILCVMFPLCLC